MDPLSVTLAIALAFAVFAFGFLVGSLVSSARQRKKTAVASIQSAMHTPSTPATGQPIAPLEGATVEAKPAPLSGLETLSPPAANTVVSSELAPPAPLPTVDFAGPGLSADPFSGVDALLASADDVSGGGDAALEPLPLLTVPLVVDESPAPAVEPVTAVEPVPIVEPVVITEPAPVVEPVSAVESELSEIPTPEVGWEIGPEPDVEPDFELEAEVASALEQPFEASVTAEPEPSALPMPEVVWEIGPEPEPAFDMASEQEPAAMSEFAWELPAEPEPTDEPGATSTAAESELTWVMESEPILPPVFESPEQAGAEVPELEPAWLLEPETIAEPASIAEPEPEMIAEPEPASIAEPMPAIEWPPLTEPAPDWPVVTEPASVQGAVPDADFAWTPAVEEVLAPEQLPEVFAPAEQAVAPVAASTRPRAHVSAIPEGPSVTTTSGSVTVPRESAPSPHVRTESIDMVAPVQMWFGDYAVAVKAGSKTHTQFRKYADVLLGELKDAGERSR